MSHAFRVIPDKDHPHESDRMEEFVYCYICMEPTLLAVEGCVEGHFICAHHEYQNPPMEECGMCKASICWERVDDKSEWYDVVERTVVECNVCKLLMPIRDARLHFDKRIQCHVCLEEVMQCKGLAAHYQKECEGDLHQCPHCQTKMPKLEEAHHKGRCQQMPRRRNCCKQKVSTANLEAHRDVCPGTKVACEVCSVMVKRSELLTEHANDPAVKATHAVITRLRTEVRGLRSEKATLELLTVLQREQIRAADAIRDVESKWKAEKKRADRLQNRLRDSESWKEAMEEASTLLQEAVSGKRKSKAQDAPIAIVDPGYDDVRHDDDDDDGGGDHSGTVRQRVANTPEVGHGLPVAKRAKNGSEWPRGGDRPFSLNVPARQRMDHSIPGVFTSTANIRGTISSSSSSSREMDKGDDTEEEAEDMSMYQPESPTMSYQPRSPFGDLH